MWLSISQKHAYLLAFHHPSTLSGRGWHQNDGSNTNTWRRSERLCPFYALYKKVNKLLPQKKSSRSFSLRNFSQLRAPQKGLCRHRLKQTRNYQDGFALRFFCLLILWGFWLVMAVRWRKLATYRKDFLVIHS